MIFPYSILSFALYDLFVQHIFLRRVEDSLCNMIKAVLFDLGGTLIKGNELAKVIQTYDRFLRSFGVTRSLEKITQAYEKANERENIAMFLTGSKGFWIEYNVFFLNELEVKEKIVELAKVIDKEWWSNIKLSCFPDVLPTINELRNRKMMTGIISNGLESDIEQILKLIDMKSQFDMKVGIDTFKSLKPDKKIFIQTLVKLKMPPHEVLFVGDSLKNDYKGAEKVGIGALLIDRDNKIKGKDIRRILDLRDTLEYV